MGSGKGTVAVYLVDIYKYTRVAFGDGIRTEVSDVIRAHTSN
jgi:adenylate kinase family enzyme